MRIYDETRQKKFAVDNIFLTVYAQSKIKLVPKVEFAKPTKKFENNAIMPQKTKLLQKNSKKTANLERLQSLPTNRDLIYENIRF